MTSTSEEQAKRLLEINSYLDFFKKTESKIGNEVSYVDDAGELITALYYRYADDAVRPVLENEKARIQVYKIVSNTELSVMRIMPIINENPDESLRINAKLAFFLAISLLMEWLELNGDKCAEILKKDNELRAFVDEHIKWLVLLEPQFYNPIFSNSQVWRLFHYLLRDRIEKS